MLTLLPPEGLNPAVGMQSEGEEVKLNLDAKWEHSDVILMSIDSCEEDWSRLHDVRINGQVGTRHDWDIANKACWTCENYEMKCEKIFNNFIQFFCRSDY